MSAREKQARKKTRAGTRKKEQEKENALAPVEAVDEIVVEPQQGPDVDGPAADEAVELRREHGGAPSEKVVVFLVIENVEKEKKEKRKK